MNLPIQKIRTAGGADYSLKDLALSFTMGTLTAVYETASKVPPNQQHLRVVSEGIKDYSDVERASKELNAAALALHVSPAASAPPSRGSADKNKPAEPVIISPS